jgi:hypothetical protein
MIENGFIRFRNTERSLDENGDPIIFDEVTGDYIPCCINGSRTIDNYSDDNGHYTKPQYTVYLRGTELPSRYVVLYDRKKTELGYFYVKTEQISYYMREIRITLGK